jgi:periplasmic protein TonB
MKTFTSSLTKVVLFGALIASSGLLRADEGASYDQRPVPVKTPPPSYPDQLRRDGVEGTVAVRVQIDEDGNVIDCAVSKSSHEGFERPALAAVRGWKFKPASKGGKPVKASIIIPMRFSNEA